VPVERLFKGIVMARVTVKKAGTVSALPASAAQHAPRVLIASHSHPMVSNGGAEIAAFELFKALGVDHEAWFLGCQRDTKNHKAGATISQPFSDREYMYSPGAFDWFKFANQDPKFPAAFRELLLKLKPDVVHFHHYLNFGVEAFLHVRETLPDARIVLTLHEYLAICHHYGQMVTRERHALCYEATLSRCAKCFTDIAPTDFFLRKRYIERFFDVVDQFVAPSAFLAQRYVDWGLPRDKITVLDNVMAPQAVSSPSTAKALPIKAMPIKDAPLRVGFFGQISVLKGINVLFDAAAMLAERKNHQIVFEIYGDYSGQPPEFQKDFLERLERAGRNVKFHGPYERERVDALMQAVDVVLVPSVWWENSPVVIQEALRNQKPIICSDIGGMAEKVRDGVDGFHFPVGNAVSLTARLKHVLAHPEALLVPSAESTKGAAVADYRALYGAMP
jgi:glycosyltransferase involved in cell wall biosynthesis